MFRYLPLIPILLLACKNPTSKKDPVDNAGSTNSKDTTGFFQDCQDLINNSSLGSLQGISASKDSIKNIYFSERFDRRETFEILFLHRNEQMRSDDEYNALTSEFHKGCEDNLFKNFNCFAFVYPMRDPDKQEDVHAMNVDFPVTIRAYERIKDDQWKFIKAVKARTFEKMSRFRFQIMYHLK